MMKGATQIRVLIVSLSAALFSTSTLRAADSGVPEAGPLKDPDPAVADTPPDHLPPAQRRGGFMFGLAPMMGIAGTTGYPNKIQEIGNPEFRREMNTAYGGGSLFVGGPLTDWFTLSFGVTGLGANQDALALNGWYVGMRLEAFPAYALGGTFRDLALVTEFGAGTSSIVDATENVVADGGSMRSLGVGAFWEAWSWWHLACGPALMYTHQSSESMHVNSVGLAFRSVYYGQRLD